MADFVFRIITFFERRMNDDIVGPQAKLGIFGDECADFAAKHINNDGCNNFITLGNKELKTTPLITLIQSVNVETSAIGTALDMKCDPNQEEYWDTTNLEKSKTWLKQSPVSAALEKGRPDVLLLLLEAKAEVVDVQSKLRTCIYRELSAECAKLLMERCGAVPTSEHVALVNDRYNCGSSETSKRNQELFAMYKLFTNARPILLKINVDRMMSRRKPIRTLPIAIKNPLAIEDSVMILGSEWQCVICKRRNKIVMSDICHHLTLCLVCAQKESDCPVCHLDAMNWLVVKF
jgi:hypothetical protein